MKRYLRLFLFLAIVSGVLGAGSVQGRQTEHEPLLFAGLKNRYKEYLARADKAEQALDWLEQHKDKLKNDEKEVIASALEHAEQQREGLERLAHILDDIGYSCQNVKRPLPLLKYFLYQLEEAFPENGDNRCSPCNNRQQVSSEEHLSGTKRQMVVPADTLIHPDFYASVLSGGDFSNIQVRQCPVVPLFFAWNSGPDRLAVWRVEPGEDPVALIHPDLDGDFNGDGFTIDDLFFNFKQCGDYCYILGVNSTDERLMLWRVSALTGEIEASGDDIGYSTEFSGQGFSFGNIVFQGSGKSCYLVAEGSAGVAAWALQDDQVKSLVHPFLSGTSNGSGLFSLSSTRCGDRCHLFGSGPDGVYLWDVTDPDYIQTIIHPTFYGDASGAGFFSINERGNLCGDTCVFQSSGPGGLTVFAIDLSNNVNILLSPSTSSVSTDLNNIPRSPRTCGDFCYFYTEDFTDQVSLWKVNQYGVAEVLVHPDLYGEFSGADFRYASIEECNGHCYFVARTLNNAFDGHPINKIGIWKLEGDGSVTPLVYPGKAEPGFDGDGIGFVGGSDFSAGESTCGNSCYFLGKNFEDKVAIWEVDEYGSLTPIVYPGNYEFGFDGDGFERVEVRQCAGICYLYATNFSGNFAVWRDDGINPIQPLIYPGFSGIADGSSYQNLGSIFDCDGDCYISALAPNEGTLWRIDSSGNLEAVIDASLYGDASGADVTSLSALFCGDDCFVQKNNFFEGITLLRLLPGGTLEPLLSPDQYQFGTATINGSTQIRTCDGDCYFWINSTGSPEGFGLWKYDQDYKTFEPVLHPDFTDSRSSAGFNRVSTIGFCNGICYVVAQSSERNGIGIFKLDNDGLVTKILDPDFYGDASGFGFNFGFITSFICFPECLLIGGGDAGSLILRINDDCTVEQIVGPNAFGTLDTSNSNNTQVPFLNGVSDCLIVDQSDDGVALFRVGDTVVGGSPNTDEFKELRLIARLFSNCDPQGQTLRNNNSRRDVLNQASSRLINKFGDRVSATTFSNLARYIGQAAADELEAYYYAVLGSFRM